MITNVFDLKAAAREKAFFRKYGKSGYTMFTIKTSRPNVIDRVTEKYVFVRTSHGENAHRIPRSKLRQVLAILFHRRVITLKEIIKIHAYSSALAALIRAMMIDICKVLKMPSGAVRLSLKGIRYFFSGISKSNNDVRIVKENGGLFVLLNYFTIRSDTKGTWKDNLRALGFDYKCVLLDPGEKTMYELMKKGRKVTPIDIEAYADFVRRHSDIIYQYLTIDKIADPLTTKANTVYLEKVVGRKPVPVYHIQNSFDVLQGYIDDGYDVIGIGGSVFMSPKLRKSKFDSLFKRFGDAANFHALGVGSSEILLKHPWFSADSSSWLNGRIFRKLLTFGGMQTAPEWMCSEDTLAYNVRSLSILEERYTSIQMDLDMLVPS